MLSTYSTPDSASKSFQIQHHISEQIDTFIYLNILSRATPQQRAMLASASAPSAGAAFTVLPTRAEFTITSPYFNQLTRLRLGLPHHDHDEQEIERSSSSQNDLVQGHVSEDKQGRLLRHNLIANAVLRISQDAGYETLRELSIQDDTGTVSRVDGALYSQYANRPPIMFDISVINPCAPSHIKISQKKSLAAASLREKSKENIMQK